MSGYREDRRVDAIRPLNAVTRNEAAEGTDLRRERQYEALREAIADDRRKAAGLGPKRSFAELLKKKP
jgi:CHASE3 domain sensor protein